MPGVTSADEATRIAINFLKAYYYWAIPTTAKKSNNMWEVRVNVGLLEDKIAQVQIDGDTGKITAYELPSRPEKGI